MDNPHLSKDMAILAKLMDADGFSKELREILIDRGLASHMNDTKWDALCAAMNSELPFPPAYQEKLVMENKPFPENVEYISDGYGDWGSTPECLKGLHIEWIRITPRFLRRGKPEACLLDCSDQLRLILKKLRIPYVEQDGFFTVYGHASGVHFDT